MSGDPSPARSLDGSPVPVVIVDRDYRIAGMNRAAETFYAAAEGEWLGRASRDLYTTSFLDDTLPGEVLEALDSRGWWTGELIQTHWNGASTWVDADIISMRDPAGRHQLAYCFFRPLEGDERSAAAAPDTTTEARFARLFEHLPEALLLQDLDGRILDVNATAVALYGYERWDLVGKNAAELVEGATEETVFRQARMLEERGSFKATSTGRRADGTTFPQELTVTRVSLGRRTLAFVLTRDLTERQRLEAELASLSGLARLHESGERIQEVASSALDVARRALSADRAALAAFRPDEGVEWLANHRMDAFIAATGGTRPSSIAWLDRALRTGQPELIDRRAAGREKSAVSAAADALGIAAYAIVPLRSGDELTGALGLIWSGDPPDLASDTDLLSTIGQLIGVALGNVRLRDSLVARQRALDESEARYRVLFEEAPEAITVESLDGEILDANRAALRLYGRERSDLVGHRVQEMAEFDDLAWHRQMQVLRREKRGVFRSRRVRADGTSFPSEADIAVVSVDGHERLLVQTRDLTNEERLQGELLQAQKMEALGQLISGVAHELNNPLSAIIAFSQLMLRDERLPADVHRDSELLMQEADRTRRIVQNLLDFARQRRPERRPTDLRDLIRRTLDLHSYALGVGRIEADLKVPDDIPPVDVDPGQIQQALLNLMLNAIQAIRSLKRPGRITITVSHERRAGTTIEPAGEWVRVTFTDDGPGVAPEIRGRLFEPFFTTREVGEGTGLGLSVSYGIATSHGGRLWYEPAPGGGSSFALELPSAVRAQPGAAGVEASASAARATQRRADADREDATVSGNGATPGASDEQRGPGGVVLVVDDEPSIRLLTTKALGRAGHDVTVAASGAEALQLLERLTFDAMLIDHRMSGMDGIETFRRAVELRPHLASRTVLMSGDVLSTPVSDAAAAHGLRLLAKPFDVEQVQQVIDDVLAVPAD